MNTNITNFGGTIHYNDNHKEYNIDSKGRDLSTVLRQLQNNNIDAEDIQPIKEETNLTKNNTLPFLITEKLNKLGTYSIEEFEEIFMNAVHAGAPKLAKFLKHYGELEVLNLKGYSKKEIYAVLKDYFGDEMDFGYKNFTAYY